MKKKRGRPPVLSAGQKNAIIKMVREGRRFKSEIKSIVIEEIHKVLSHVVLGVPARLDEKPKPKKRRKKRKAKKVKKAKAKATPTKKKAKGNKKKGYTPRVCSKRACDWSGVVHARTRICPECGTWNTLKSPK